MIKIPAFYSAQIQIDHRSEAARAEENTSAGCWTEVEFFNLEIYRKT